MTTLLRITAAAAIFGAMLQPLSAEDADLPAEAADQSAETETVPRHGIVTLLMKELGDNKPAPSAEQKLDEQALDKFYQEADRKPIWVSEDDFLQGARDVAAEFARADDYGLDPAEFKLPAMDSASPTRDHLGGAELMLSRAVLKYARHARGGRIKPGTVGQQLHDAPEMPDPYDILVAIASSEDAAAYLRSLHPQHPQFEKLRKRRIELRDRSEKRLETRLPSGPVLRLGTTHDHVALLRKRLGVEAAGGDDARKVDERKFDKALVEAVKTFQRQNGLKTDGVVGAGTRKALNGQSAEKQILKLLVNMERWRWLPENMAGEAGIYVWANIPEFRVRIVKGDEIVFKERVIVGKVDKQTPVFTDKMEWIEIHPTWYVPNSIKVADILPSLRRRTSKIMDRYHLQVNCGRHGRDPTKIDWSAVDIRNCSVSQPPGQKSVLGDFKFKFPNKHAVYMHDTLTRGLFSRSIRTFSHGCVRIQNPRRMAEILLAHDKGMTSDRIGKILAGPRRLHKEELTRHVPVHMTYFTALFDDKDGFMTFGDYYGNDRRLAEALTGKGHLLPVASAPGRSRPVRKKRRSTRSQNWWNQHSMQN